MTTPGLGLKALSRNVGATFGRQIAAAVLGLVTMALIARAYGPEGMGAYAVALLLPTTLTTFLNLGVAPANVYHLGSGQVGVGTLLRANIRIALWLTAIGIGIGSAVLTWYSELFFPSVPPLVLWLALAMFPLALLTSFLLSVFQGLQQFRPFNTILVAQPTVLFVLVLSLAAAGSRELVLLIGASFLAQVLMLALAWAKLRPLRANGPVSEPTPGFLKKTLGYGWKAHLSNILAFVNYRADIFIANLFLGPASVGVYVVSVAFAEKLWMISQSVSTVLLPRLSQLTSDETKRKQLTPLIARWVLFTTLLGASIVAVVGGPFIYAVFGTEYRAALTPLLILLPGIVAGSVARVLANDIAARGRPELNLYTSIVVVTVNIIGNVLLIPRFGLAGAAGATTIAYTLNLLLRLIIYGRFTQNRWADSLFLKASDVGMLRKAIGRKS